MQKFFEDHLQEALQDQSKRLAQLESSRMKGRWIILHFRTLANMYILGKCYSPG